MRNLNKKTFRPIFIFIVGIVFILANSSETLSQDLNMNREPDTGFKPGLSYSVSDFEAINTTNGNINFIMPLGSLPAGRGTANAGITLQYDSSIWKTHIKTTGDISGNTVPQQFLGPNNEAGWRYGNKYRLEIVSRGSNIQGGYQCTSRPDSVYTNGKPDYRRTYNWKVKVHFPDGSQHEFRPSGYSDRFPTQWGILPDSYYNVHPSGAIENVIYVVNSSPVSGIITASCQITTSYHPDDYMTYYSSDGSYLKMIYERTGRWTIYFRDGSRLVEEVDGTQHIYDRNNNSVHSANIALPNGATGYGWKDEFGRYTAVQYGFAANEDRIYNYGFNGQLLTTRIIWKRVTILRRYRTSDTNGNGWHSTYSHQYLYLKPRVIDKIILPIDGNVPTESTGLTYTFEYDAHDGEIPLDQNNPNYSVGWGRVKSVTMPTTAKVEYEYDAPFDHNNSSNLIPEYVMAIPIKKKTLSYTETYDGNSEEKSDVWLYNIKHNNSSITSPSGAITTQKFGSTQWENDLSGLVKKQTNPDGSFVENIWKRNIPDGSVQTSDTTRFNQYIKTEFATITNNAGNPSLTKIMDYEYDKNGNVTEVKEYDWVAYSAMPKDSAGNITGIPSGIPPVRRTQTKFVYETPSASISTSTDSNIYCYSTSPHNRTAVDSVEVKNGGGTAFSRVEYFYDDASTTGNLIKSKIWDSYKNGTNQPYSIPLNQNNSIETTTQYDQYGNPTLMTDAKVFYTKITYGSINGYSGLYPTETKTALGETEERTSSATYDFHTGLIKSTTDLDNNVTSATEYDDLGRPTKLIAAFGTPFEIWTTIEYNDELRRVVTRSDLEVKGDGKKVSIQHFNELGRIRLSRAIEDIATEDPYNELDGIKVQIRSEYDNGIDPTNSDGIYSLRSNPYRAATSDLAFNEDTMGWSISYQDKSGKYSTGENFSGAMLPAPWGNNSASTGKSINKTDSNVTTVTDAEEKQRRSIINALGQLTRTDEPNSTGILGSVNSPTQATYYKYNTLGKMTEVTQGVQKRHFLYDSLSRLIRVRQPEQEFNSNLNKSDSETTNTQWTAGFTFDVNGNVLTATDAENKTITSTYDKINRPLTQTYSDGITPNVTYTYDDSSVLYSKGRLTRVENSISLTKTTEFDIMGRPKVNQQVTDGVTYQMKYVYSLAGQLIEEQYPSGRKVKNDFDANGDISRIYGSATPTATDRTYANSFAYSVDGRIQRLKIGNGRWESAKFNSNMQATEIALGTSDGNGSLWKLNYEYGELNTTNGTVDTSKNTGNVAKQTIDFDEMANPFVQTYEYDSLYRIKEAKETSNGQQTWKQTYDYDKYGNRTAFAQNIHGENLAIDNITLPQVNAATNRFNGGQGYEYDKIGNLTKDVSKVNGVTQSRDIKFNGDNKQIEIKDASTGIKIGEYFYDGSGKRVKKRLFDGNNQPVKDVIFVYSGDKLLEEYSTQPPSQNPTTKYVATDTLGSVRAITDSSGTVISRRDFMPFGEELQSDTTYRKANLKYNSDDVRQKFTGYQKDEETGLDFAEARMYNNTHARFTAVDPLLASGKSANPQTFNRYVYVMNNPIAYVDPDGLQTSKKPGVSDKKIVVPKRLLVVAGQNTIGGVKTVGAVKTNFIATLPRGLVNFKVKLVTDNYTKQARISSQSFANSQVGEMSPTQGTATTQNKTSTSKTDSTSTTVGVDASQAPSVSVSGNANESKTEGEEETGTNTVGGPLTNIAGAVKDLMNDNNIEITNYLNANEDKNQLFNFTVTYENGDTATEQFTRNEVEKYLTTLANQTRAVATCDYNRNACPR